MRYYTLKNICYRKRGRKKRVKVVKPFLSVLVVGKLYVGRFLHMQWGGDTLRFRVVSFGEYLMDVSTPGGYVLTFQYVEI